MTTRIWHTPSQAAPELGYSTSTVRDMCATKQIECRVTVGPRGAVRYHIHRDAIAAYNRRHTQRVA